MKSSEEAIFRKHFAVTRIDRMILGGVRINTPTGFVEFKRAKFKTVVGGADIYRGIVRSAKDFGWNPFIVDGDEKHIVTLIAHGMKEGVEVIPELKDGDKGLAMSLVFILTGVAAALFLCQWVDGLTAAVMGLAIGGVITLFLAPTIEKITKREAWKRGQPFRPTLPDVHGDINHPVRKEEIDDKYFEP